MGKRGILQAMASAFIALGGAVTLASFNPTLQFRSFLLVGGPPLVVIGIGLFIWLFLTAERNSRTVPPTAFMTPFETIHYLSDETEWGRRKGVERVRGGMRKIVLLEAFDEFRTTGGQTGAVRVYGRLQGEGEHGPIPATHWMSSGFDHERTLSGQSSSTKSYVYAWPPAPSYSDLLVSKADVLGTWRRISYLRRIFRSGARFVKSRGRTAA